MYLFLKRTTDIILSLMSLIALLPFFIPLIIILKLSAEGEIFYKQKRIGYQKNYFYMIKFATMLKNSLNLGTGSITLRNDFRVTKIGKLLRKTKINELPQIVNILIGDISVVGPRPLVEKTFNAYPKYVQDKICSVKPGLTGIGSIFFRDEEEIISNSNYKDPHEFYRKYIATYKGDLELWYIKNRSLIVDIKIIFITAWVIIFPKSKILHKLFKGLPKNKLK